MARRIEVELTGDTSDFERALRRAGDSVEVFESNVKDAGDAAGRFDGSVDKITSSLEGSSQRFRDTADLAGGLGDLLGIEVLGQVNMYATAVADMADGMSGLLGPALAKSQVLFKALNLTMLSNPIFLVVAAIAALTVAFVIAYKKSETFRNIVNKAFSAVKDGARSMLGFVSDAVQKAAKVIGKVADIITTPYQIAFKAIARMWNATLGGFGISIPGFSIPFGPSFGGLSFTIPNIPTFRAAGGPLNANQAAIVGERGPELFIPSTAGTVVPNGQAGGGVTVMIETGASDLDELIRKRVRVLGNGSVQKAYGY